MSLCQVSLNLASASEFLALLLSLCWIQVRHADVKASQRQERRNPLSSQGKMWTGVWWVAHNVMQTGKCMELLYLERLWSPDPPRLDPTGL